MGIIDCNEPIHEFFGLSYCSYLVLPRSVLQSMPKEWQSKFVELLEEADKLYECPEEGDYTVYLRDENGKFKEDIFRDYQRGRRYIEPKQTI